jgi:hypothetical protein
MQSFFCRAARELRNLQFVAVVPNKIHFGGEITQELRVLVLELQPQHFGLVESTFHGFF